MQPGRGAKRIEQLSKRCDCRRRKRLLIHSPMNAENNGASGAIEESGSYYVADTGLGGIIIVPFIAPKDSLGQTFGKLDPTPARSGREQWSIRVPRAVIVDISIPSILRPATLTHSTLPVRLFNRRYPTPRAPTASVVDCSAPGQRSGASAASEMREIERAMGLEVISRPGIQHAWKRNACVRFPEAEITSSDGLCVCVRVCRCSCGPPWARRQTGDSPD